MLSFDTLRGSNGGPPIEDEFDAAVMAVADVLLRPRATAPPHLETCMAQMRSPRGLEVMPAEPLLLHLFGFQPGEMPYFGKDGSSALGKFCEAAVIEIGKIGRDIFHTEKDSLKDRFFALPASDRKGISWKNPDFGLGSKTIVELKYRYNTGQGATAQYRAAQAYRKIGLDPILIHLSPDCPKSSSFESNGWRFISGDDAYDWLTDHLGLDVRRIFAAVGQLPAVKARLADARQEMRAREVSELKRALDHGNPEICDAVYQHIAQTNKHMGGIMSHLPDPEAEKLRQRTTELYEERCQSIPTDKPEELFDFLHAALDNEQKEELTRALLDKMSDTSRLEILSTHG
jgi:hypothetical protein